MMNSSPTTEERIWAVLSHLSALAFGMGIVIPILGWSEQRHKSKFASFQCLQALGYQSLGYTIWLLSYLVIIILFTVVIMFVAINAGTDTTTVMAWVVIFMLFIFSFLGLYFSLPVIKRITCPPTRKVLPVY